MWHVHVDEHKWEWELEGGAVGVVVDVGVGDLTDSYFLNSYM